MTDRTVTTTIRKIMKKPTSLLGRRLAGTITRVETHDPVLALTFDDGPHPEYTPKLLEILNKYHARATFFCVGKFAAKHPEVIRQVVEAGHVVGNHTWDHVSLPLLTHSERCAQIRKCEEALQPYGGHLFRPPYGHQNLASRLDLLLLGYQVVAWTHAAGDWQLTSPEGILEQVLPSIRSGRIIDFHDRIAVSSQSPAHFNREPTLEAVNLLLERFNGSYRFVTLPELFRRGHVVRENWYRTENAFWHAQPRFTEE